MDQAPPAPMDSKKLTLRPGQQAAKPYPDYTKDVNNSSKCRSSNRRQQQQRGGGEGVGEGTGPVTSNTGGGVGGIGGGGGGSNSKRSYNGGQGATASKRGGGGWGRAAHKTSRNREKEGGQINCSTDDSLETLEEYVDDKEKWCGSSRGGKKQSVVWSRGSGPNSRRNDAARGGEGGGRGTRRKHRLHNTHNTTKKHGGNAFLQASCQFVVNPMTEAKELLHCNVPVGCTPDNSTTEFNLDDSRAGLTCGDVSLNSIKQNKSIDGNKQSLNKKQQQQQNSRARNGSRGNSVQDSSSYEQHHSTSSSSSLSVLNNNNNNNMKKNDNPDTPVSWDAVEEVLLHMTEPTQCPICLYPPVAPQVTKCGHIYCYNCMLHYLALSDKKWRSCPICDEMIVRTDLKSAVCMMHPSYRVGSNIEMSLMKRERHSMLPGPVSPPPNYCSSSHSRKTYANKAKMLSIIERERCALDAHMAAEGSQPEACFIEQALTLVSEREAKLMIQYHEQPNQQLSSSDTTLLAHALHNDLKLEHNVSPKCPNDKQQDNAAIKESELNTALSEAKTLTNNEMVYSGTETNAVQQAHIHTINDIGNNISCSSITSGLQDNARNSSYANETSFVNSFQTERNYLNSLKTVDDSSLNSMFLGDLGRSSETDNEDSKDADCLQYLNSTKLSFTMDVQDDTTEKNNFKTEPEQLKFTFDAENERKASLEKQGCSASKNSKTKSPRSVYYFYQASDGSHVYLHNLNLTMLTQQYGALENCPLSITANIVQKEYGVMSDAARYKTKYLAHLPLHCPYETVELLLRPPLVSQQIIANFESALATRERERLRRIAVEEDIEKRVQALQDKEFSCRMYQRIYSSFTKPDNTQQHAASFSYNNDSTVFPSMNVTEVNSRHSFSSEGGSSPELATSPTNDTLQPQLSFAKMVQAREHQRISNRSGEPSWPSLGGGGGRSCSATAVAWGSTAARRNNTTASEGGNHCTTVPHNTNVNSNDEADFNAPEFRDSFSMSFGTLLQNATTRSCSGAKENKKKKKQRHRNA